ncbi:MAG: hypothetical protein KDA61_00670, partial [Planctomycetales bacterium]|nr:hypothetical protein [Planctomycetales bacterium]
DPDVDSATLASAAANAAENDPASHVVDEALTHWSQRPASRQELAGVAQIAVDAFSPASLRARPTPQRRFALVDAAFGDEAI